MCDWKIVIEGVEVDPELVRERLKWLRVKAMVADTHCDDEAKQRYLDELGWLSEEYRKSSKPE